LAHRWGFKEGITYKNIKRKNSYEYSMSRIIIIDKVPDEAVPDMLVWLMKGT
jgi:hypothetical protein